MNDIKILIVDDTVANLDLIITFLSQKGYKTIIAKDGESAIKRATTQLPDLILLDIQMPILDGFKTCEKLKSREETKDIPIIFMTALTDTTDKVKAFQVGGVDYITKPIDSEELFARVNTHLTISKLRKDLQRDIGIKEELLATQKELFKAEKIASLGYLVTGVAHELNTPLGIGITSASMIKDEISKASLHLNLTDPRVKEFLESVGDCNTLIENNLKKIGVLINEFKELSTSQTENLQEEFLLSDTIEKSAYFTLKFFNRNDIEIKLTTDFNGSIVGDHEAIERVVNNLVENSIIHGFEDYSDKTILINIIKNGNNIELDYRDSGKGIPQDVIEHIFDPFFTTKKATGTGLGLSIVYNIVTQKLGGDIKLINSEKGASFSITFPISPSLQ